MKRHAISHGAGTLASTLAASLLIPTLRSRIPEVMEQLDRLSYLLVAIFDLPYRIDTVSVVLFATLLAVLWGFGFALAHRGQYTREPRGPNVYMRPPPPPPYYW